MPKTPVILRRSTLLMTAMTNTCTPCPPRALRLASLCLGLCALAVLAACGGGGGSPDPTPLAAVTSATISAGRFGSSAFVQVSGTNLDNGLTVSSSECTNLTLLAAAPYVSSATIAYYSCTVARMSGAVLFEQKSSGATLATAPFTVSSLPQVQMSFTGPVSGSVVINLAADKVPVTVVNFLRYVNAQRYDGLIIHRVAVPSPLYPLGIVQGGGYGPTNTTTFGAHVAQYAPIPLNIDATLHNTPGTIAMASSAAPNSATSEFYFNVQDNSAYLDGVYAVFGSLNQPADIALLQAMQSTACTAYMADGSCLPIPNVVSKTVVQIR
jgi:cyclophilin family peptidyl-prolyl cis-trans isomerase